MAAPIGLTPLPPVEAIRAARAQTSVLPAVYYGEMAAHARQAAFTVSGLASIAQIEAVRQSMVDALATGETFSSWQARVRAGEIPLGLPSARREVIFRNNVQSAYNRGRWQRMRDRARTHPFWMYDAVNDSRTRPTHAAMDNTILRHDHPWWATHYPPNGHQCFLPGALVSGAFVAGSRFHYTGEAVEIVTTQGARLAVTINHPILTPDGFVPACALREGSKLLCHRGEIELVRGASAPDSTARAVADHDTHRAVEQVFDALAAHGCRPAQISPLDFHGDGSSATSDQEVDDVAPDGLLSSEPKLGGSHGVGQLLLAGPEFSALHLGLSESPQGSVVAPDAQGGGVSCSNLSGTGIAGHPGPFEPLRLGSAAHINAVADEHGGEGLAADSAFPSHLIDAGAGQVFVDQIASVRRFPYSGHVYDLETVGGWLAAGGIITHNCRCRVIALTTAEAERRGITATPPSSPPDQGWDYSPGDAPLHGIAQAADRVRASPAGALYRERLDAIDAALAAPRDLLAELQRTIGAGTFAIYAAEVRQAAALAGVSIEAAVAVRAYTGNAFYRDVNAAMRYIGGSRGASIDGVRDPDRLLPIIGGLYRFFEEARPLPTKVTRMLSADRLPASFVRDHRPGSVVAYESVTSASAPGGEFPAGDVVLTILQRSGRAAQSFSPFGAKEREIMIPPGTLFEVVSRRKVEGRMMISVREIDAADVRGRQVYHFGHG